MCSGQNNFATAPTTPLDPLFGPAFLDQTFRRLSAMSVEELLRLVRTAERGERLSKIGSDELRRELIRRMRRRRRSTRSPGRPKKHRLVEPVERSTQVDPETVVDTAATMQLRDLRALRRLVPDEAEVVFALQPIASSTGKELSDEEESLFAALDVIQAKTKSWQTLRDLHETSWSAYAARLEHGCGELGIPVVDLSRASYTGWCFVDRIHMTGRGYEIAATFLQRALTGVPR